jgi:hypothetical protein
MRAVSASMLHRLGVDALDTGARAILVVQLAHWLGWANWSAEDLDSAPEVDQIARHSTSVKSACGVPSSGRTLCCSMFGSADSNGDACQVGGKFAGLVARIRSQFEGYVQEDRKYGLAMLQSMRVEERRQCAFCKWTCLEPALALDYCLVLQRISGRGKHSERIGCPSRLPLLRQETFDKGRLLEGLTMIMTLLMQ